MSRGVATIFPQRFHAIRDSVVLGEKLLIIAVHETISIIVHETIQGNEVGRDLAIFRDGVQQNADPIQILG